MSNEQEITIYPLTSEQTSQMDMSNHQPEYLIAIGLDLGTFPLDPQKVKPLVEGSTAAKKRGSRTLEHFSYTLA